MPICPQNGLERGLNPSQPRRGKLDERILVRDCGGHQPVQDGLTKRGCLSPPPGLQPPFGAPDEHKCDQCCQKRGECCGQGPCGLCDQSDEDVHLISTV